MIDFEPHLSSMLDDVAGSIHPHSDPDSLFHPTVKTMRTDVHRFRPRFAAVAAAGIVLLGGSAFAMEKLTTDPVPAKVRPADSPATEPTDPATTTTAAPEPAPTTVAVAVETTVAHHQSSKPVILVEPNAPPTEPPTTAAPVVIEFTAKLGADGRAKTPMTQGFYGAANPGSAIRAGSPYGVAEAIANGDGKWELTLVMKEVPAGTKVPVRITSSTSDRVREFTLERPAPPAPAVIEFTAALGANGQANTPMTQGFYGTAQPGSAIRISCDWGVAETTAGPLGKWDATLVMNDVPPGTLVHVRITSSTTTVVREFTLQRPGEVVPPTVAFTAAAGWATTDHTPPTDSYSGTATAGSVITLSSEYGGAQTTANGDGHWSVVVEFPSAPVGSTFSVHITSSQHDASYDIPLSVVGPV